MLISLSVLLTHRKIFSIGFLELTGPMETSCKNQLAVPRSLLAFHRMHQKSTPELHLEGVGPVKMQNIHMAHPTKPGVDIGSTGQAKLGP